MKITHGLWWGGGGSTWVTLESFDELILWRNRFKKATDYLVEIIWTEIFQVIENGNNVDLNLLGIIEIYISNLDNDIQYIQNAILHNNLEELIYLADYLKSPSYHVWAIKIYETCNWLEQLWKSWNITINEAMKAIDFLRTEAIKIKKNLKFNNKI